MISVHSARHWDGQRWLLSPCRRAESHSALLYRLAFALFRARALALTYALLRLSCVRQRLERSRFRMPEPRYIVEGESSEKASIFPSKFLGLGIFQVLDFDGNSGALKLSTFADFVNCSLYIHLSLQCAMFIRCEQNLAQIVSENASQKTLTARELWGNWAAKIVLRRFFVSRQVKCLSDGRTLSVDSTLGSKGDGCLWSVGVEGQPCKVSKRQESHHVSSFLPRRKVKGGKNHQTCDLEVAIQNPINIPKTQRHEKVTQKWLSGSRWKWLTSCSKVTQKWRKRSKKVTFGSLSPGARQSHLESLFRVFEFFGVWGSVGLLPGHNTKPSSYRVFLELWFAIGWPSRKRWESRKRRRQLRQPQTRGSSAGSAEITEATDMTKGIWGANDGFPQTTALAKSDQRNASCHVFERKALVLSEASTLQEHNFAMLILFVEL